GGVKGTVRANGRLEFVQSSGQAFFTIVSSGGTLTLFNFGTANNTQVKSGGYDYVQSGGTDYNATVSGGGQQQVYGGAQGTGLLDGGIELVQSGGGGGGPPHACGGGAVRTPPPAPHPARRAAATNPSWLEAPRAKRRSRAAASTSCSPAA